MEEQCNYRKIPYKDIYITSCNSMFATIKNEKEYNGGICSNCGKKVNIIKILC